MVVKNKTLTKKKENEEKESPVILTGEPWADRRPPDFFPP